MYPSITVMVLSYNSKAKLELFLGPMLETDYPYIKVMVIDNNSTDGSAEFVKQNYPTIEVIELDRNYGLFAYNQTVSRVDSEFVALVNDDVMVTRDWLRNLVKYAIPDDVAMAVPKVFFWDKKGIINAAGGIYDIFGAGCNRGNGEEDLGQYDEVEEVFYGGIAMLIRKSVWQKIGGFDQRYFMYAEDSDWCWRARIAGYKVIYVPSSVIYHQWHSSSDASFMAYMILKNEMCNFLKNYGTLTLALLMPAFILINILKTLWLLLFTPRLVSLSFKASYWNLRNLRSTLKMRKEIERIRIISDKEIRKHMVKGSLHIMLGLKRMKHPFVGSLTSSVGTK
jgi:GT2 family glycosyltransferase